MPGTRECPEDKYSRKSYRILVFFLVLFLVGVGIMIISGIVFSIYIQQAIDALPLP